MRVRAEMGVRDKHTHTEGPDHAFSTEVLESDSVASWGISALHDSPPTSRLLYHHSKLEKQRISGSVVPPGPCNVICKV